MEGGAASAGRRVGEISPDGQFRWGGAQWEPLPAGYREPTSWTRPLRLVTAGYLVLSVLYALITNALFLNPATTERAFRTSVPDASAEQVQQAVTVTVLLGWSFLLVVSVISLVVAVGSYRGWRWAFWGALVWLGLNSIGILTNLSTLTRSGTPPQPPVATLGSLLLSIAALALFVWLLVAAIRHGPWAMRKPTPTG